MLDGVAKRTFFANQGLRPGDGVRPQAKGIPLDTKELKILLDPKRFKNVEQGKARLWDKIEDAADEAGIRVKRAKDPEVRTQDVLFLDTEQHDLKEQGYILRYRDIHGSKKDDNLTLKYRGDNPFLVMDADVSAAQGFKAKSKFELDETFTQDEKQVYSKSTKVKVADLPEPTVENLTEYFPALADVGLSPQTRLENMREGIVEERHLLGQVRVGGSENAPAYLTLWYDESDQKTPAVAEFSFAHTTTPEQWKADQESQELMRSLHDNAPKWICADGSTKTNFAYSD